MATPVRFTWAQAAHTRDAAKDNEVSFKKGDVLKVFQKYPNGWWVAENNGKMGVCPGSWLRDISEEDAIAKLGTAGAAARAQPVVVAKSPPSAAG